MTVFGASTTNYYRHFNETSPSVLKSQDQHRNRDIILQEQIVNAKRILSKQNGLFQLGRLFKNPQKMEQENG
jgi:hypothetical protein